jgi:hypothetical protein
LRPTPVSGQDLTETGTPAIVVSGLATEQGVRYSITLPRPDGLALRDVHLEAELPPEADVTAAFDALGRTAFLGQEGGLLAWSAPDLPASGPVVAFAFQLTDPIQSPLRVRASWSGDPPRSIEQVAIPDVGRAAASDGVVVIANADDAMQAASG